MNVLRITLALLLVMTLGACGGGAKNTPLAPSGISVVAGNTRATVSWGSVNGATSYNLYWSTQSGVNKATGTKVTTAVSPYTFTGLSNGANYYYVVTAVNGSSESVESSRVTATPAVFSSASVVIDLVTGLISFPNRYSGWSVGGDAMTNFVAHPAGWTVGGGTGTNFVAVPPGWSVGGVAATNFVALPPGWSAGGLASTNFVAVPPQWSVGGLANTNFVALPPGWSAGGLSGTNFVSLPPGWTAGGLTGTNYIALPAGWTASGSAATNFVGLATGWATGGNAATNLVALPPGWTAQGDTATNFVSVATGWVLGGKSATNYVTYPDASVTTIKIAFNDPGFLGLFQNLQASGNYDDANLSDIIMSVYLNTQPFFLQRSGPWAGIKARELAPAGQW